MDGIDVSLFALWWGRGRLTVRDAQHVDLRARVDQGRDDPAQPERLVVGMGDHDRQPLV
jgi:hypothetical protein